MKKVKTEGKGTGEPTRSELEILQILWKKGASTAREINDELNREKRAVIYMSTLKLMQIMVEKGFLKKDESQVKHIYRAVVEEKRMKGRLLNRVVENIFDGSASGLMMQLFGNAKLSPKERAEFESLIKKLDKK
jgi:BlaI family penicillinase repressor